MGNLFDEVVRKKESYSSELSLDERLPIKVFANCSENAELDLQVGDLDSPMLLVSLLLVVSLETIMDLKGPIASEAVD